MKTLESTQVVKEREIKKIQAVFNYQIHLLKGQTYLLKGLLLFAVLQYIFLMFIVQN
ncbi:hypothetical protein ZONE111904_06840 [Zobellia nedashkovskayae]